VAFRIDDQERFNEEYGWGESRKVEHQTADHRYTLKWQPGEHSLNFDLTPLVDPDQKRNNLDLRIASVQIEGPLEKDHWIKPENYERFFSRDQPPQSSAARDAYAREILVKFATRAFR